MINPDGVLRLDDIERICADERDDWQRKVNQGAMKQALGAGAMAPNEQIQALGAMDAIQKIRFALIEALRRDVERQTGNREVINRMYAVKPISKKKGAQ